MGEKPEHRERLSPEGGHSCQKRRKEASVTGGDPQEGSRGLRSERETELRWGGPGGSKLFCKGLESRPQHQGPHAPLGKTYTARFLQHQVPCAGVALGDFL